MTTYASPRLTRNSLSISLTITFLIGFFILIHAIFQTINTVSEDARRNRLHIDGQYNTDNVIRDFPSTNSPLTELIIGTITLIHSIVGIVAVNIDRSRLFAVHAYLLLISCAIKLLLVLASTSMHIVTVVDGTTFLTVITQLTLVTCLLEIVLIFCGCQYAKLLKRGDAARQEIQSLHSYHLERRSRSRSVSRGRSMYGSRVLLPTRTPTRMATPSLSGVRPDELVLQPYERYYYDQETDTFIVPPPSIFLELDR